MSPTMEDCPICLESMDDSDRLFPLLCSCQYNMCRSCIVHVIESSESGYSEASDGSMQLKTNQKCPQCRFDLRYTLRDTMILRQAHVARSFSKVADFELNATQLRLKHDFLNQQDEVKHAAERYHKAHKEGVNQPSPDKKSSSAASPPVPSESATSPVVRRAIDFSLFQGLEPWLNEAEQVYLSELLTSGEVSKLVIAAHILFGVSEASVSGHARLVTAAPLSASQERKRLEQQARFLKRFPLPQRMPRYVLVSLPISRRDLLLRDEDDKENLLDDFERHGAVMDAMKKLNMLEAHPSNTTTSQRKVLKIVSIKGALGRLGLRKGDIITHLNGEEYTGTASELQTFFESNEIADVNIIVNADLVTATALKQRAEKARGGGRD